MLVKKRKEGSNKKAISPVIATVLLIAMVIVIGLIIFLWFRSLTQEAVTKFGGTNIGLVCEDVDFSATYDSVGGILTISNLGNVPIFSFKLQMSGDGNFETGDINDVLTGGTDWPSTGLRQGGLFSSDVDFGSADSVVVIPVLIGSSGSGEKTHICDDRFGQEVL